MELSLFVICLLIFGCTCYWIFKKNLIPKGLKEVPNEPGLPLIGLIHKLKPTMPYFLQKLSRKLGPIFKIKLGMRSIFVLNSYDWIRKALLDDGNNFSGRWKSKFISDLTHDSGILMTDGNVWATQRSFILKVLRDFGVGKSRSAEIVQDECLNFLNELTTLAGQTINFSTMISIYSTNIISRFIMNKRYRRDDPKVQFIENTATITIKTKDYVKQILLMFPMFDRSSWFSKLIMMFTTKWQSVVKVQKFFEEEIEEHRNVLDYNSEGEDLISRFLIKQHQLKQSCGNVETFVDWQLIINVYELFIAGSETTSTTLTWSCFFMSKHQDIQEKVRNEIVEIIGRERLPTMNDKKLLNYTQAVMDEILRLSSVAPLSLIHRTFQDTSLNGYYIPKDSLIFPNLFACHIDPDLWENPTVFYPEHFLILESDKTLKYRPREELIPFSIGKRQCLGESLARTEFFLFFTSMMQRFQIRFTEEISEKEYFDALIGNEGVIKSCKINDFIFSLTS